MYLRGHLSTVHDIREVAIGFWSGLRAVWVFVVVAPMLMMSKGRAAGGSPPVLAVAATFVANVPLGARLQPFGINPASRRRTGDHPADAGAAQAGILANCGGPCIQLGDSGPARHRSLGNARGYSLPSLRAESPTPAASHGCLLPSLRRRSSLRSINSQELSRRSRLLSESIRMRRLSR